MSPYRETDLVRDVTNALYDDFDGLLAHEFDYQRGRVDIVGVSEDGDLIAFEAKLTRWRDALRQAFRNACFARQSYVVLPARTAEKAMRFRGDFEDLGIGIVSVENGGASVVLQSRDHVQIQPWLTDAAICFIVGEHAG